MVNQEEWREFNCIVYAKQIGEVLRRIYKDKFFFDLIGKELVAAYNTLQKEGAYLKAQRSGGAPAFTDFEKDIRALEQRVVERQKKRGLIK